MVSFPFEIAGGSVAGSMHRAAGRNNQDAFCWTSTSEGLVAVVCDGCGSAPHSEVGARIGARIIAASVRRLSDERISSTNLLARVAEETLCRLGVVANAMSAGNQAFQPRGRWSPDTSTQDNRTVGDHLLFTVVGVLIWRSMVTTFSLGDGIVIVNGNPTILGPWANNEPPYLGYGLLEASRSDKKRPRQTFVVHDCLPLAEVHSVMIGTDGATTLATLADRQLHGRDETVGPLSQFWLEDRFFRNPDNIRRRLAVIQRGAPGGVLSDDTTLVVLRKRNNGDAS